MKYLSILVFLILLTSCEKDQKNIIARNQLGDLNNTTKIFEIKSLLKLDSIVNINARNAYGRKISSTIEEVEVYDTSGRKVLTIKPGSALDSVSPIKNIRIFSEKYKTKDDIALGSTFAELKKYHDIGKIQSSLKSVIITLKDINAFVSFDREDLPGDVRFDLDADIRPTMIPDDAKINRFWLNFTAEKDVEK